MNFEQRKRRGNLGEMIFKRLYDSSFNILSPFTETDFTTTTGDMKPEDKWVTDFYDPILDRYIEVKTSAFWNQAEFDWQFKTYGDKLHLWISNPDNGHGKLIKATNLKAVGPYKGNKNFSGLPYYKMFILDEQTVNRYE